MQRPPHRKTQKNTDTALGATDIPFILLCNGHTAEGQAFYAYIKTTLPQAVLFYKAQKEGTAISFTDIGHVVLGGEGLEPPLEAQQKMADEYGADHMLDEHMVQSLKALDESHQMLKKRGLSQQDILKKQKKDMLKALRDAT